ncbi:MAG: DUF4426 domain-containing protein [Proteobacteria bacterium]|nr:DUF4426 domain-containing protein [Pseudomonadota bacterium]
MIKAGNFALIPVALTLLLLACEGGQESAINENVSRVTLADHINLIDFGDYVVHINAIVTSQVPADVARNLGITRSDNRAMLNVVITRKIGGAFGSSVKGTVTGTAVNLVGQLKNMTIREVTEHNAIYYIGEVVVVDGETLFFNVDVTPDGESRTYHLRYKGQFYSS